MEEPIPHTCPDEAESIASVASVVPTTWLGQPAYFGHLLEIGDVASAVSVQLMDLSVCGQILFLAAVASAVSVQLMDLSIC